MARGTEFRIAGVDEFNRKVSRLVSERQILKVAENAFRKTARHIRSEIVDESRKRGVLKRIYGRKRKGLNRAIKLSRVKRNRGDYEAPLKSTSGLMFIQETGGRFRPHTITPKTKGKMVFVTHGKLVATTIVKHPGATHPKMPVFWPAVRQSGPRLRNETAEAIRNFLRSVVRA